MAGILVAATLAALPTLGQPLTEAHAFRQTQTAFTARIFHEQGIDLLHPQLPVLGEPWEVPMEFPLFQALGSVTMSFGVSPDLAMRITGFATFLLTAVLIWGLVRYVTRQPVAAGSALVAFMFSPLALVWSRASMIEYSATAGAVGFAFAGILWLDTRRWFWAVVAIGAGIAGMLVKPTSVAFWVLPIVGWVIGQSRWRGWAEWARRALRWTRVAFRPQLLVVLAIPFLAAFLWTRHADAIKAASPATEWLTERNLRDWNYGTLGQRLDLGNWRTILGRGNDLVVGPVVWGALLLPALLRAKRRWFWLGVALTGILPIVVFFNLYVVHDYYLTAVSPGVAMLLGAGVGWLYDRVRPFLRRRDGVVGMVVLGVAWLASILLPTASYWRVAYEEIDRSAIAAEVPHVTAPEDRLVVVGQDWSSHLLYYANRRGMMLTYNLYPWSDELTEARRRRYEYFVALAPSYDPIHHLGRWPWIGVVSEHVYRVGEDVSDVASAPIVAASDSQEFGEIAASGVELMSERSLECDVPHYLPRGAPATWIRLDTQPDFDARYWIDSGLAPLPAFDTIVVRTQDPDEPLIMRCTGAGSLEIESINSGPAIPAMLQTG